MTFKKHSLSEVILKDFEARRAKRPSYSLRAYARFLNLPPSSLHGLLNGKVIGSRQILSRIAKKLELTPSEVTYFDCVAKMSRTQCAAKKSQLERKALSLNTRFNTLSEKEFELIWEWHHFAIMELIKTKNSSCDPRWIARKLAITRAQAAAALDSLERLEIIARHGSEITVLKDFIALPSGAPLSIARDYHREMIQRSLKAIDTQPKGTRNFSSLTVRFRKTETDRVDAFLRRVRREFSAEFEQGKDHDSVYALNLQFIRLDQED